MKIKKVRQPKFRNFESKISFKVSSKSLKEIKSLIKDAKLEVSNDEEALVVAHSLNQFFEDLEVLELKELHSNKNNHKTVHIEYDGVEADVDEELAPLLLNLLKLQIAVTNACQESRPGWASIDFFSALDLEQFLNIVTNYSDEKNHNEMYTRIARHWEPDEYTKAWEYELVPMDYSVHFVENEEGEMETHYSEEGAEFIFGVSVCFPRDDLDVIKNRIEDAVLKLTPPEPKKPNSKLLVN